MAEQTKKASDSVLRFIELIEGVAAGRSSRVLQRTKCLPHVVEITQSGFKLLRVQRDMHILRRCAPVAIVDIQNEQ